MSIPVELRRWRLNSWLNWALGFSWLSLLFETLALIFSLLPPNRSAQKGSVLYWALILPCIAWAMLIADFNPWAMLSYRKMCLVFFALGCVLSILLYTDAFAANDKCFSQVCTFLGMALSSTALFISSKSFFADFLTDVRTIKRH
jgi:hypothetical protein